MRCVVIRVGHGDDADGRFAAKRLLEQEPRPARMDVLRQHVETFYHHAVCVEIFALGEGRTISAVAARYMRRHHLHQAGRDTGAHQSLRADTGRSVVIIDVTAIAGHRAARRINLS